MSYLSGWRLAIIGDGPDRDRLERLARDRGLSDRIEFAGWLSRGILRER
jgi:glycosyltransferase involved in cell wall biosynthesis